jgi:hypothetical protein
MSDEDLRRARRDRHAHPAAAEHAARSYRWPVGRAAPTWLVIPGAPGHRSRRWLVVIGGGVAALLAGASVALAATPASPARSAPAPAATSPAAPTATPAAGP